MRRKKEESVHEKAFHALRAAARDLVQTRAARGEKVVVWKNGKVAHIPAVKFT
jgi:hypothetical protein